MKKYSKFLIVFFLIYVFCNPLTAQGNNDLDEFTSASNRADLKNKILNEIIKENLSSALNQENEEKWISAFWGMGLLLYTDDQVKAKIKAALDGHSARSLEFQRALLEAVYTIYPNEFLRETAEIVKSTSDPKIFAMAVNQLLRSRDKNLIDNSLSRLKNKFPDYKNNPILFSLEYDLLNYDKSVIYQRPSLIELLSHDFGGKTIIYSLQRKNRDYRGLAFIKGPDGKFLRNTGGNLFFVPQLARAINNLPGYLTNGNTPQGIFSIQGIEISKNSYIGPTPNIQTVLPFEADANKFFHGKTSKNDWDLSIYKNLLPSSWQNYEPIYQSYYAGKAGRNEIIVHGTAIDPEYYAGKNYFPNTPSLGCLCAKEIWSETGVRIFSDQQALVDAFLSVGTTDGFLVVVEIDDKHSPVDIDEILLDILKSEK
jgi:hypothetical protein